jgi:hypothetical protein
LESEERDDDVDEEGEKEEEILMREMVDGMIVDCFFVQR